MAKTKSKSQSAQPIPQTRSTLTVRLQIAAGVFVPMLAMGLWLNSKGFFG